MSEPEAELVHYRVAYSERVRIELRSLRDRAVAAGHGRGVLDALRELDDRLRIYPQAAFTFSGRLCSP